MPIFRYETDTVCFSIPEFCEAHGISRAFYYQIRSAGNGPVEMKVGRRRMISAESAAAWRKAREDA
jgi:hypothetical protein